MRATVSAVLITLLWTGLATPGRAASRASRQDDAVETAREILGQESFVFVTLEFGEETCLQD